MQISFIQALNETQINAIEGLAREIWFEHYIDVLEKEQIRYMLDNFQSSDKIIKSIKKNGYSYFLIQSGIKDKAQNCGYFAIASEKDRLFLSKLYLLKDFRSKGIGKQAIGFILKRAAELGAKTLWLTVNKQNLSSIEFYKRAGFVSVKSVKTDIGGGFFMDDYVMEKSLI